MSILSRLFGGGASKEEAPSAAAEEYEGFAITPAPAKTGGGWRIGATIEKDGRRHDLIRADTLGDRDAAVEASVMKARQIIDQQGDRLFD
jgi:hypothetical protein